MDMFPAYSAFQIARPTIMVVDDDASIATLLYEFLSGEGYRVLVARNGRDALARIKREPPALVLCDWMMPAMDGPHLIAAVRHWQHRGAAIPVVLMSSAHDANEALPGIPFVAKPFALDTVLDLVTSLTRPTLPPEVLDQPASPPPERHDA